MRKNSRLSLAVLALLLSACADQRTDSTSSILTVRHWNTVAIDASGLDHTPVAPGENRVFGENVGPGRASRAMAIAHIAMFEAANAIDPCCRSYVGLAPGSPGASMTAAVSRAAHDTLAALYPSQAETFASALEVELARVRPITARIEGEAIGRAAAAAILAMRAGDGSNHPEPRVGVDYIPSAAAGKWRPDPVSKHPLALGARWAEVRPFALSSASQFRAPAPPALESVAYENAYAEVLAYGGDGVDTPMVRDEDQTMMGIFWAYDGMPALCAPPRLYNQVTVGIARDMGTGAVELARLLALVNVAMADAGIAAWESKYFYEYWRPVTGIREADAGTGPSGAGDGNPLTVGDPTFLPMGAPASNAEGPNFTPPFPAYPSGHATFGGALFQTLRRYYGRDDIAFTFVSDELNGVTMDNHGVPRPMLPRTFSSLSQAEEENGQSRIYLGIHWEFDKTEGIAQGREVANYVFDHMFQRTR